MKLSVFDYLDLLQILDEKIENLKAEARMGISWDFCGEEIGKCERLKVLLKGVTE